MSAANGDNLDCLVRHESATDFMLRKAHDFSEWLAIGRDQVVAELRRQAVEELEADQRENGPRGGAFAGVLRYAAEYVFFRAVRDGEIESDPATDRGTIEAVAGAGKKAAGR